jgi:hypothetical protein
VSSARPARSSVVRRAPVQRPAPSRRGVRSAPRPMVIMLGGFVIPLRRVVIAVLLGVTVASSHLSVCSLAAYKEGKKQGLRSEISRLQWANRERERELDHMAWTIAQRGGTEGLVRLPVDTIAIQGEAVDSGRAKGLIGANNHQGQEGIERRLADGLKAIIAPKGRGPDERNVPK